MPKQPIVKSAAPAVYGSDVAPIIYFDGVLAWGQRDGVAQLELACNHIVPTSLGSSETKIKIVVTAHIRCSQGALEDLMQAIEKLQTTPQPLPKATQ